MSSISKRLMNIAILISTLYFLFLIAIIFGFMGGVPDWDMLITYNFGLLAVAYAVIAAINYVAFGTITLWHQNTTRHVH